MIINFLENCYNIKIAIKLINIVMLSIINL